MAGMSGTRYDQILIGKGYAVGCEFDAATNTFNFAVSDGSRKTVSLPTATADEIARMLDDLEASCVPVVRS